MNMLLRLGGGDDKNHDHKKSLRMIDNGNFGESKREVRMKGNFLKVKPLTNAFPPTTQKQQNLKNSGRNIIFKKPRAKGSVLFHLFVLRL